MSEFSRRQFMALAGSAAAGVWLTATRSDILAAGLHAAQATKFETLTPDDAIEIEAATAQIVPTDATPGAREARVVYFIDKALSTLAKDQQPEFESAAKELRSRAAKAQRGAKSFASLPADKQIAVLTAMEKEKPPFFGRAALRDDRRDARESGMGRQLPEDRMALDRIRRPVLVGGRPSAGTIRMPDHTHPRLAPLQQTTVKYRPDDEVDFVVVGSGAAGGVVAKELSTAGFRVVVLEQGPWRTERDFVHDEIKIFQQSALSNDWNVSPNTFRKTEKDKAQKQPALVYARGVGGTSVHFSANFWRFREIDFKEASVKGTLAGTGFRRLADHVSGSRAVLHEGGLGDRRRRRARTVRPAALAAVSDAAASAEIDGRAARARRAKAGLQALPRSDGDRVEAIRRPVAVRAVRLLRGLRLRGAREIELARHGHSESGGHRTL